ncbi:MAG: hypothetical protein ACPHUK_09620 [Candidatus Poseidoniaceae archaeon]
MAEWKHKERNWSNRNQDNQDGDQIRVADVDNWGTAKKKSNFKEFTDWLDWQCEDGWEVFKISRNFGYEANSETWCVFRKKLND